MVPISLVPALALLYFYVSTFRSMCAVPNMAIFCSSFTSFYYYYYYYYIVVVAVVEIGHSVLELVMRTDERTDGRIRRFERLPHGCKNKNIF